MKKSYDNNTYNTLQRIWQANSEQKWRLGDVIQHDNTFEQTFDFVWLDDDDIRRIGSSSHYQKATLLGTREEITRLGPLVVDFLNANRLPESLPRIVEIERRQSEAIAEFVVDIANFDNSAIGQLGSYMATQSPAHRARVIERLSSMIGSIAELDAK